MNRALGQKALSRRRQALRMPQPNKPSKPDANPTNVREPDNTRPPSEPTPTNPQKPMSTEIPEPEQPAQPPADVE